MKKDFLSIVITGHVDHGKSTLIGRLLLETGSLPKEKIEEIKKISRQLGKDTEMAYLTDQLEEERRQNMTIDTTQIFFKSRKRNYVIIDSPGHLELIKNMITGSSLAQAAILIVDTAEGVKEQTRRHAYIISMLGITNVIAVLNKMDLVNYSREKFKAISGEIEKFFKTLDIKPSFIIPISAKEGVNISKNHSRLAWYKGPTFLEALDSLKTPAKAARKFLRFPVQDIYGAGGKKIMVGKILSGTLSKGEEIKLLPSYSEARVSAIEIFGKTPSKAKAGENIGIVLDKDLAVKRGDVFIDKRNSAGLTGRFKGDIFWMSSAPLEINKPLNLRLATQEVKCVAEKIEERIDSSTFQTIEENAKQVRINESAVVIFKTDRPLVIEKFSEVEELGRFVLERDSNLVGAGIIT